MRKLGLTGLTVAAAVAAGTLAGGGIGSAASGTAGTRTTHGVAKLPAPSTPPAQARARAAAATSKMYLRVTGVPGESQDVGWVNQISLASYSWGTSVDGSGKAALSDLTVLYPYDRSVPPLETRSETGGVIPTVQLSEVDNQTRPRIIRSITLSNAKVDAVTVSGSGGGTPYVSVSFSYQREETDYYLYGSVGSVYRSCWDVVGNKTC